MHSAPNSGSPPGDVTSSSELLRFDNASIGYARRTILRDLDFSIRSGDYLAIVGSNGSGKTTLLRAMLGLLKPLRGSIGAVAGRTLHYGYVPQLQAVDEYFPLSVSEVVLMGRYGRLGALRRPAKADHERAQAALDEVGIQHLSTRLYRELSGGQKQRALIARALTSDPDLLVLDEHTNDLDIASEKAIMSLIDGLHAERGLAIVMVSHSLNTVANHCRNIGIISDAQCRFAPVEDVLQPEYLQQLYGVPLRVLETEGTRVVV
jgi:ABC-type Mn2+/Zn2+ transport system ATPase subunit